MKFILEVTPPVAATPAQIKEWVQFQTEKTCCLPNENPLSDYELGYDNCSLREY